ncbi:MAG: pentapeptide repeat-containing protein [Thermoplasmata archaeon]
MTPESVAGGAHGVDYSAFAPSGTVIGSAIGTFPATYGPATTTETSSGSGANCPVGTSDCYSLQLNSNEYTFVSTPFTGTSTYNDSWQQFVYENYPGGSSFVYIQYVLINSVPANDGCTGVPSPMDGISWSSGAPSQPGICYGFSPSVSVPSGFVSAPLGSLVLEAYANYLGSGNDVDQICGIPSSGLGCVTLTMPDNVLDLAPNWQGAEFNVFGDAGGSQANFAAGTTLTVSTSLADQSGNPIAPSCQFYSETGETDSLFLGPCSANSTAISFTEGSLGYSVCFPGTSGTCDSPTRSTVTTDETVLSGQTASYNFGVQYNGGTPEPVTLSLDPILPAGATAQLTVGGVPGLSIPYTFTLSGNTSATLTVSTVRSGTSVGLGDFALSIQAAFGSGPPSGQVVWTATANLHVYDFSVAVSPPDQTVLRAGNSADYGLTLTLLSGSSTVAVPSEGMSVSGLPSDAIPGYPSSILPTFGGSTGTLVVTTGPSSLGDFAFTVAGTDPISGGSRSGSATLHVYDFSVQVLPSALTVLRGGNPATYYLDLTLAPSSSTFGIPGEEISVSGLPSGTPPPTLSASAITPTLAGCSPPLCPTLTVTTSGPPSGPLGDSTFTVMGTDLINGGSRSSSANLHIFDFAVTMTPSESLYQGESITVKVSLPLVSGSTTIGLPTASLSLTGLPSGVVAVGFPALLIVGGTATYTLETSSVGSYISCPQVSTHGWQYLRGANLAHCDLAGYNLRGDNLQNANLLDANLSNANLAGANLQNANLASANTSGTDFQYANMQGVDLSAAGAIGTFTLTITATVDGSSRSGFSLLTVSGDQLSGDNLGFTNLQGANLAGDLAVGTCFQGGNLQGVDLAGADLQGANLPFANLQGADLAGDLAVGANFLWDNLMGVDLAAADLQGASLQFSNLQSANLAGVLAVGANFQLDNLGSANLAGADLQGANFQGANLQRADLAGALLTGLGPSSSQETNFNWANLARSNLTGAICGTPNYITAFFTNTHGIVGVPASCNPPLDPAPATMSLAPMTILSFGLPNAAGVGVSIVVALGAILGAMRATRGRRPPAISPARAGAQTGPATASESTAGPSGRASANPTHLRQFGTTYESELRVERETYQERSGSGMPP